MASQAELFSLVEEFDKEIQFLDIFFFSVLKALVPC